MKTLIRLTAVAFLAATAMAQAQASYPSEPLRIVVPTDPGGSVDTLARIFQREIDGMGIFPATVVVNQPGAGGTIGTRAIKDATADGHTIGIWHPGIITSRAMGVVDFDHTAFTILGGSGLTEIGMGVLNDSPYKTPQDMIAASQATPNSVVVATNIGLPVHFIPMMFDDAAGIQTKMVQIGGGSARLASILGGHTDIALFSVSEFLQFAESGLRPLFLYSDARVGELPDTPTAKESGVDLVISDFRVWLAPAGIGDAEKARLQEVLKAVVADPEIAAEMQGMGMDPAWMDAADVAARLDDMNARVEPLIAAARAAAN